MNVKAHSHTARHRASKTPHHAARQRTWPRVAARRHRVAVHGLICYGAGCFDHGVLLQMIQNSVWFSPC